MNSDVLLCVKADRQCKKGIPPDRVLCYHPSMRNQRVEEWEEKLNDLLKRVDHALEERYGSLSKPHPARPPHGSTANPQQDGLFRITASFTPGFGSTLGKGYVLQFDLVTLDTFPEEQRATIRHAAIRMIEEGLEGVLPGRGLTVKQDGDLWKIVGDLSLSTRTKDASCEKGGCP